MKLDYRHIVMGVLSALSCFPAMAQDTVEGSTINAVNTTSYLWKDGSRIRPTATITVKGDKVDTLRITLVYKDETIVEQKTELGLKSKDVYSYRMRESLDLDAGESAHYTMTIETGDSKYVFNSSLVNAEYSVTDRRVVCEEGTGTWCGFCIRGAVGLQEMKEKYPDFIGIAVHYNDVMQINGYGDEMYNTFFTGLPECIFNRTRNYTGDPYGDIEALYRSTMAEPTVVSLSSSAVTDREHNKIEVRMKSSYTFTDSNTPLAYSFVIVENGVTADGDANYYQKNYYSGGSMGEMGGYESKPEVLTDFVFNDLARYIHGGLKGVDGSVGSVVAGEEYEKSFVIDIPSNIRNLDNIEVVTMVIDQTNGQILNADMVKPEYGTAGIYETACSSPALDIRTCDGGFVLNLNEPAQVSVYSVAGTLVEQRMADDAEMFALPSGCYIIKAEGSTVMTGKVVVK